MEFSLAQIQSVTNAQLSGAQGDVRVKGWSIDSRTVERGDLFFALSGENFNGHSFVATAFERGAAAAVVSETVEAQGALLRVENTLAALQQLGSAARRKWAKPVVAVTGSAGKTSTKDIIAALLGVRFRVGKTVGNFNNNIGLPLSILRIEPDREVAILEMGMNHAGEIRDLCAIAEPEIGVVTNVGYAHVENFDSIEGVAAAKRELIEALPASGTAVLNADDPLVSKFGAAHKGRTIFYGFTDRAEVRAENVSAGEFTVDGVRFQTQLSGRHSIANVLAGIAVARIFGIEPRELTGAVAALAPGKMRGERHEWNGVRVLNDSYNSNPEAAREMLDVLRNESGARKIAVLGEMRELGAMSERLHREVGAHAAQAGVDLLLGIRGAAEKMVAEAAARGLTAKRALFFETPEAAGEFLKAFVREGDVILFKGSRGTRVELALAAMEQA